MRRNGSVAKSVALKDWTTTTLGELVSAPDCFIQTGPFGSQLHKRDYQDRGIGVVNPTHMLGNKIIHDDIPRVSAETATRLERHRVSVGDILFARRGEIGRHGLVTSAEDGWLCGTGCFLVRIRRRDVENRFLSYFISTRDIVDWLNRHAAGVVMPNLNSSVLQRLPLCFPSLEEQQKIIAVLGLVQRAMEQQERLVELTAELKKALLYQLFTHGLYHEPQKQTELGPIPQSWESVRIETVGRVITGGTPSTKHEEYYGGDYNLISPADLDAGKYVTTAHRKLTEEGFKQCRALPKDAVMVGCIGNVGKIGMTADEKSATNQQINSIVCNEDFNPHFIFYCLQFHRPRLERAAAKVTVPILNKSNFENFQIAAPKRPEQDEVAEAISVLDRKFELHRSKHAALSALFRTLLYELMTARICVHDLALSELEPKCEK